MPDRYPCPCCGFLTLAEKPPGSFDICPVCFWEDDAVQFHDPTWRGGANRPSLREARENYKRIAACDEGGRKHVRPPLPEEVPPSE